MSHPFLLKEDLHKNHVDAKEFVCDYISREFVKKNDESFTKEVEDCAYLYQTECLSDLINPGLRKGIVSRKIANMIDCLSSAHQPLGKEIIMYRGIPRECLGEKVLYDPAFNSVTPDPKVAEFFSDVILEITFTPQDKLLYFAGKRFYPDTLEFITLPGISYRVDREEQRGDKLYVQVTCLGSSGCVDLSISDFDDRYSALLDTCVQAVRGGDDVVVKYKDQEAYVYNAKYVNNLYSLQGRGWNYDFYMDLQTGDLERIEIKARSIW